MNKIAFIDDEANVLESLKWIFQDESSYILHFFQSPFDALTKIREQEFAVVISDHKLPVMNGTELLKHVKEKWPLTECFITTSTPIAEDLKNTEFPVIVKPWDVEDLKVLVQKAVSKYMENHKKKKKRILFIDNDPDTVTLISTFLKQLDHEVAIKINGNNALEEFRSTPEKYDMVITELKMMDMTGIELAEKLLDIQPDIPIVLCTDLEIDGLEKDAKKAGIREIIMKPFSMDEIAKVINNIPDP